MSQEFFCPFVLTDFCRELIAMSFTASEDRTLLRLTPKKILLRQTRQEPVGTAPVVSASGVGAATALTEEEQPMAVSMGEQAEEGGFRTLVVGAAWPVVSSTS